VEPRFGMLRNLFQLLAPLSDHTIYVLGPVPGVGVMAKRPQGWVKCEDHLPYYTDSS
jgi:hypothetical protein